MDDPRTAAMLAAAGSDANAAATDPRTAAMLAAVQPTESKKSLAPADDENPINAAVGGFLRQSVASIGAASAGGLRGIYDIATGKGSDQAAQDVQETANNALGYRPKSPAEAAGARAAGSPMNPLNWPGMALSAAGKKLGGAAEAAGASPAVSAALETAPTAAAMLAVPARAAITRDWAPYKVAAEEGAPTAQEAVTRQAQASPQSQGAAAAAPRVSNASPQLQQAIVSAAQRTGGAVNPDALARHVEADTLPVPIRLTEGEALGDVTRISNERNNAALADFYNKRNGALKQNIQDIRDDVGPDVFSRNSVEHGDTLIKAYQDKAKIADDNIDAKYQALRDANGGKFPVDVKQLASNVEGQLHQQLLYEHAPVQLGQLKSLANKGNMTFEQFEAMRTNLARTMRSSTDGNERAAAGIIRQQMEQLPLSGETAQLKPLADAARSAAKSQFDALDADPAYKAAVQEKVAPDDFVRRFVIGGKRDNLVAMKENLKDDPVAQQTLGVAAIDYLRDAAKVNPDGTGTFTQAGFNKALRGLDPKIRSLLSPEHAETLEQLGNVARYTQEQPAGNFINNSKTFVAAAAEGAKGLAEHAINARTLGIGGTAARSFLQKRSARAEVKRITAPGAGLDLLDEKP